MEERRKMRRFTLRMSCLIHVLKDNEKNFQCHAITSNVGIGGAFVETDRPMPIGTHVRLELLIQCNQSFGSASSCINLNGTVVRWETTGMAVAFEKEYEISRIPQADELEKSNSILLHHEVA